MACAGFLEQLPQSIRGFLKSVHLSCIWSTSLTTQSQNRVQYMHWFVILAFWYSQKDQMIQSWIQLCTWQNGSQVHMINWNYWHNKVYQLSLWVYWDEYILCQLNNQQPYSPWSLSQHQWQPWRPCDAMYNISSVPTIASCSRNAFSTSSHGPNMGNLIIIRKIIKNMFTDTDIEITDLNYIQ
jgi:hypothetical protein